MIKKILFVILILAAAFTLSTQEDSSFNREEAYQIFKKMKTSELGSDVFESIMVELENKDANVVDKIISLLEQLRDQFTELKNQAFVDLGRIRGSCYGKVSDIEDYIAGQQEKLARFKLTIPLLNEQRDNKQQEAITKQADINANNNDKRSLNELDTQLRQKFEAGVKEHNDMIEALTKAKKIIQSLVVTGFLQTKQKTNLVDSFAEMQSLTTNKKQKGLMMILTKLATSISQEHQTIHASQDQVENILTIIDELINYERESIVIEQQAEGKRKDLNNYRQLKLQETAKYLDAIVKDLVADASTLNLRADGYAQDITFFVQNIKAKGSEKDLETRACDEQTATLSTATDDYNTNIDLIRSVIRIFKQSKVQDVKSVVSDVNTDQSSTSKAA